MSGNRISRLRTRSLSAAPLTTKTHPMPTDPRGRKRWLSRNSTWNFVLLCWGDSLPAANAIQEPCGWDRSLFQGLAKFEEPHCETVDDACPDRSHSSFFHTNLCFIYIKFTRSSCFWIRCLSSACLQITCNPHGWRTAARWHGCVQRQTQAKSGQMRISSQSRSRFTQRVRLRMTPWHQRQADFLLWIFLFRAIFRWFVGKWSEFVRKRNITLHTKFVLVIKRSELKPCHKSGLCSKTNLWRMSNLKRRFLVIDRRLRATARESR